MCQLSHFNLFSSIVSIDSPCPQTTDYSHGTSLNQLILYEFSRPDAIIKVIVEYTKAYNTHIDKKKTQCYTLANDTHQ